MRTIGLVIVFLASLCSLALAQEVGFGEPSEDGVNMVKATNNFIEIYTLPAPPEEKEFVSLYEDGLGGNFVYYRNPIVGYDTGHSGAVDGDWWSADAHMPDGSTVQWGKIVFYDNFNVNGELRNNCFVLYHDGWWESVCGSTYARVWWHLNTTQCAKGQVVQDFTYNGAVWHTELFNVVPRINPDLLPYHYNQGEYGTDPFADVCRGPDCFKSWCDYPCDGRPGERRVTIRNEGCYVTTVANLMGHWGGVTDPVRVNEWFRQAGAYTPMGRVISSQYVAQYAWDDLGILLFYMGKANIRNKNPNVICTYGPAMVQVPGHWMLGIGSNETNSSILVLDPSGGVERYIQAASVVDYRPFGGPEQTYVSPNGITTRYFCPIKAKYTMIDATGQEKVCGFDENGNVREEIPGCSVTPEYRRDDDLPDEPLVDPEWEIEIMPVPSTEMKMTVEGTATGTWGMAVTSWDNNTKVTKNITVDKIPTYPGKVDEFIIQPGVKNPIELRAKFNGTGQNPTTTNLHTTFGNIDKVINTLPPNTTYFDLLVLYNENIQTSTFRATLNRKNISSLFHPAPASAEVVRIPLAVGKNILILTDGADKDKIIFTVPTSTTSAARGV